MSARLYLDGVLDASVAYSGSLAANNLALFVGGDTAYGNHYLSGSVDEVNIFGWALGDAEVSARYNATGSLRSNLGVAQGARQDTLYYYLGGRLVAQKRGADLAWVSQDHLSGTALVTDTSGNQVGTTMRYYPFGEARPGGSVPTDRKFTGQRLDGSGLYYLTVTDLARWRGWSGSRPRARAR